LVSSSGSFSSESISNQHKALMSRSPASHLAHRSNNVDSSSDSNSLSPQSDIFQEYCRQMHLVSKSSRLQKQQHPHHHHHHHHHQAIAVS
jgi:zinc finger protein ZIC